MVKDCLFKPKMFDMYAFRSAYKCFLFSLSALILLYVTLRSARLKVNKGYCCRQRALWLTSAFLRCRNSR